MFFQRNSADTAAVVQALGAVLSAIPVVGPGLTGVLMSSTANPYQITGTQSANIVTGLQRSGYKVHHCFTMAIQA